ncbi:MAG: tetratricopeptide repeat protein [Bryobacterales bacterium]
MRLERSRTLRSGIRWSYDLLDPETQRIFRRLAVFSGGGCLQAAGAAAQVDEMEVADALQMLAAHHLVRIQESHEGEPRFHISEANRLFALEELDREGERGDAQRRHAEWHLALAERGAAELTGKRQLLWLDRLEAEHANFAAALDWAIAGEHAESAFGLAANLWRLWLARARAREGYDAFERVLRLPRESVSRGLLARTLNGYAMLAQNLGRNAAAKQALAESLESWRESGDEAGLARALNSLAWVHCELCDLDEAKRLSREALVLHERTGDKRGAAVSWNNLAWIANYRADGEAAREAGRKSLSLRRAAGDLRGEGFALACLAWTEQWSGEPKAAHKLLDEASRILLPVADPTLLGWTLTVRALTLLDEGKLDEADEIVEKSLREWKRGGNLSGEAWVVCVRGAALLLRVQLREADAQLERAAQIWRETGSGWGLAMALGGRARALARRGSVAEAKLALGESLALRRAVGDRRGQAHCIETAAELAGAPSLAAQLLGVAERIRDAIGAPASIPDQRYRRDAGLVPAGEMQEREAFEAVKRIIQG